MQRVAARALAGGAEGDMQGQEVLVGRMGLARMRCQRAVVRECGFVPRLERLRQPVVELPGPGFGLGAMLAARQTSKIVRGAAARQRV